MILGRAMTTSTVATIHSELLPAGAGRSTPCQLVVIEGPDMGRALRIEGATLVVGTDPGCDLRLTDDRVSSRHLSIERIEGGYLVRDLGSRNGTVVQGVAIAEARLAPGATLKLGRSFVRLQTLPQAVEIAPSQARRFGELVAESLAMREVFAVLELSAGSDVSVLLEGETGVGKELAARAVHEASARRRGPFVAIDCSALPETLIDSELFGHVKGAFTGATGPRKGAFQRADGGTLFLDELGSVPPAVESRLLRALEERAVRPVGADAERAVDVRLIAASRQDLLARVTEGTFRPDLYYRLSVVRVTLPPLRRRREDIAPIVAELLRRRGLEPGRVAGPALDRLFAHEWPGNVRELRNVVDRALALTPGARCFADLRLDPGPEGPAPGAPLGVRSDLPYAAAKAELLAAFERRYLADVLGRSGGNISAAARAAGIGRKHLRELARRHGLVSDPD
jgi:DNA-binding NtrC family response regulator